MTLGLEVSSINCTLEEIGNVRDSPALAVRPQQVGTHHDGDVARRHLVQFRLLTQLRQELHQVSEAHEKQ